MWHLINLLCFHLYAYTVHGRVNQTAVNAYELLDDICNYLEAFQEILDAVSEDQQPSLHRVIPLRQYLMNKCEYHFQRRTNDFRFIVTDLREYNSTLKLGRISIRNTFCAITPFLAGNRMTYCTRCWRLGHMRDKCDLVHPRCRICLNNLMDGQTHDCSNVVRCAQCDGHHHSLSNECEKVAEYRFKLKEQINNAISTGKLHRLVPQDRAQPMQF
ncbi:unnamed protein product [Rotaria sp. Silwood2]|nr:unnamed protein product [Rotaria sp. Silwood2]